MHAKLPIAAAALLIILGAGVYAFTGFKRAAAPADSPASGPVTFHCSGGKTMEATFATSTLALALSDGRTFALPQVVSGSGIRYEAASAGSDIVFVSKGDNAFLTQDGKTTFENCTAAFVAPSDAPGYATYTDLHKTFTFAFPTNFSVAGAAPGYGYGWTAPATTTGMVLATILVPKSYEPGTNFGDARFSVGVSSDPSAVATCLLPIARSKTAPDTVVIGDTKFTELGFTGVGAGNIYDTTSYRTVKDGACYALEYTIHYSNIQNYPTDAVKALDEEKVTTALDEVARSFRFLR